MRDNWLEAKTKLNDFSLSLAYHRFDSDRGSAKYGDEWNTSAGYSVNQQLSALLKLAYYNADTLASDTTEVWLMLHSYQL